LQKPLPQMAVLIAGIHSTRTSNMNYADRADVCYWPLASEA
jgi:hypothetical protein